MQNLHKNRISIYGNFSCDFTVTLLCRKMGINALQILSLTTSKNRTVKPFSAAQCGFYLVGALRDSNPIKMALESGKSVLL